MTRVEIIKDNKTSLVKIKDIRVGELFRYDIDGRIFLMTDEEDKNGKAIALYITDSNNFRGILMHFDKMDKATRLDGTITVEID